MFDNHDSGKIQPRDTKPNFGKAEFTRLFHLSVEVLSMRGRNCRQFIFKSKTGIHYTT